MQLQRITHLLLLTGFLLPMAALHADDPAHGKEVFERSCTACHTIGGGKSVGPDLKGVLDRHDHAWLVRWIQEPDVMIAEKDPVAIKLLEENNNVPMTNMGINEADAQAILDYFKSLETTTPTTSTTAKDTSRTSAPSWQDKGTIQTTAFVLFISLAALITAVFLWVAFSTKSPTTVDTKKAYKLRSVLFVCATVIVVSILAFTMPHSPYPDANTTPNRTVYATSLQFSFLFSDDPIASTKDMSSTKQIHDLVLPKDQVIEFRVTTLDVTHNFAVYNSAGSIVGEVQAMPGYVNRLRLRFTEPGRYEVLCLEYCGLGHHRMRTSFKVE